MNFQHFKVFFSLLLLSTIYLFIHSFNKLVLLLVVDGDVVWVQLNGFYRLLSLLFPIEMKATNEQSGVSKWASERPKKSSRVWNRHEHQTFPCVCARLPSTITTHSSQFKNRYEENAFSIATKMKLRWRWRWRWRWRRRKMKWNETRRIWIYNLFLVSSWKQNVFVGSQHWFPLHLHHIRFLFVCACLRRVHFGYPSGRSPWTHYCWRFFSSFLSSFFPSLAGCFSFIIIPDHRIDWIYIPQWNTHKISSRKQNQHQCQ